MICPNCRTPNDGPSPYCLNCGEDLERSPWPQYPPHNQAETDPQSQYSLHNQPETAPRPQYPRSQPEASPWSQYPHNQPEASPWSQYPHNQPETSSRSHYPSPNDNSQDYPDQHSDKYPDKYPDQHSDKYSDQYSGKHSDKYSDQHSDKYSDPYSDQHSDKYSDQYSNKYSDQYSDQYSDRYPENGSEEYSENHLGDYPGNGAATGALVCGILGFILNLPLSITAIILGKKAQKEGYPGGKARVGVVLGVISIVATVLAGAAAVYIFVFGGNLNFFSGNSQDTPDTPDTTQETADESVPLESPIPVIVCLGDSYTYGYPVRETEDASWPKYMEEDLKKDLGDEVDVINEGRMVQRSGDLLERFDEAVAGRSGQKPTMVIIFAGMGDAVHDVSLDMFKENIPKMIQKAEDKGITPVLVMPFSYPEKDKQTLIDQYREWLKTYAQSSSVQLIDFQDLLCEQQGIKKEYTDNGKYPNVEGYKEIGKYMAEQIKDKM